MKAHIEQKLEELKKKIAENPAEVEKILMENYDEKQAKAMLAFLKGGKTESPEFFEGAFEKAVLMEAVFGDLCGPMDLRRETNDIEAMGLVVDPDDNTKVINVYLPIDTVVNNLIFPLMLSIQGLMEKVANKTYPHEHRSVIGKLLTGNDQDLDMISYAEGAADVLACIKANLSTVLPLAQYYFDERSKAQRNNAAGMAEMDVAVKPKDKTEEAMLKASAALANVHKLSKKPTLN